MGYSFPPKLWSEREPSALEIAWLLWVERVCMSATLSRDGTRDYMDWKEVQTAEEKGGEGGTVLRQLPPLWERLATHS
jgi:hypothetical protein